MLKLRARRVGEKDLLAFANELASELGGGGKDGLEFGIDANGDIWIFGKKMQTAQEKDQEKETAQPEEPEEQEEQPEQPQEA